MAEAAGPKSEDAASLISRLHETGEGLVRESAEQYLSKVREERDHWRGEQ